MTLRVNNLVGFGANFGLPIVTSYVGFTGDGSNSDSYTFTGASIGAAGAGRVIVAIGALSEGTPATPALTIDGNAMMLLHSADDASNNIGIFAYRLATGTTANFVLSGGSGYNRAGLTIYNVYNARSLTAIDTATDTAATGAVYSDTINALGGGAVIAGCIARFGSSQTCTWAGVTEDFDTSVETSSRRFTAGHVDKAAGETSMTVSATWTNTPTEGCMIGVSLR